MMVPSVILSDAPPPCCTHNNLEQGRLGRCAWRASTGGCRKLGTNFVNLCPVACGRCSICEGHPQERQYATIWKRIGRKLTPSMIKLERAACGPLEQEAILKRRRRWLRWAVEGNATRFGCEGTTQRTCTVSNDFERKTCMRRRCNGKVALNQLTPQLSAHDEGRAVPGEPPAEAKLLKIGRYDFLGGDYGDFMAFNLLWRSNDSVTRNGVFVEAGAFDGLEGSNTWFFEKYLGWSGVLVEPSLCGKCLLGPNRPGSSVFNGAICNGAGSLGRSFDDDDRTLDATEMSTNFCAGPNATWAASLKGTRAGVPIGGDGGSCVAAAQRAGTGKGASRGQVVVPCRSLTQILSHHLRRKKIDFFSLDVETYDMEALRGLDFNAFDITSMLVECRTGRCRTHLREQGYATILLTNYKDGMRGYLGDVLAWKAESFRHLCETDGWWIYGREDHNKEMVFANEGINTRVTAQATASMASKEMMLARMRRAQLMRMRRAHRAAIRGESGAAS